MGHKSAMGTLKGYQLGFDKLKQLFCHLGPREFFLSPFIEKHYNARSRNKKAFFAYLIRKYSTFSRASMISSRVARIAPSVGVILIHCPGQNRIEAALPTPPPSDAEPWRPMTGLAQGLVTYSMLFCYVVFLPKGAQALKH